MVESDQSNYLYIFYRLLSRSRSRAVFNVHTGESKLEAGEPGAATGAEALGAQRRHDETGRKGARNTGAATHEDLRMSPA
jgi:hypothetical protein